MVQLMKRIVRLNAVENICPEGILGMNQHSLHPNESLSPQKLIICGVSLASPILVFPNTLNINNRNILFRLKTALRNIRFNSLLSSKLLNQLREVLSFLVLWVSITVVVIFAMGRKIRVREYATDFFREAQLYLVKVRNRMKFEVLHRVATQFMCEKVVYTYKDTKTVQELAQSYQMELLWEGKK